MVRNGRQETVQDVVQWWMMLPHRDDEAERDEAEHRRPVLDDLQRPGPDHQPRDEHDRDREDADRPAGDELERQADAAQLRGEHHEVDDQLQATRDDREVEPERFAHGVGERVFRDGGETARHLGEEDETDGREGERPDQLEAKRGAAVGARRDRPDLEEAADAGDDAEGDLQKVHRCLAASRRRRADTSARLQASRASASSACPMLFDTAFSATSATWRA